MLIFPAIDIYEGKAVRLFKGDYSQMTVYGDNPVEFAKIFKDAGAENIHIVDLEGAKNGSTPNFDVVKSIKQETGLFCEIGGGIRSFETIEKYVNAGIDRVILGTAAVTSEGFVENAVKKFGDKIAVGIDIKDGYVAIKGWTEKSAFTTDAFCEKMQNVGVKNLICTDISKDGAMQGTNRELYKELSEKYYMKFTASGGVSTLEDIKELTKLGLYAAIIGKAYYTGAIDLRKALEVAQ